jgi:hypothetical protein
MARRAITTRKLVAIEGIPEVLANIAKVMNKTTAESLKKLYIDAAKPVWSTAKRNISGLNVSPQLKQVLDAMVMINSAIPRNPYVLVGMSQQAGIRKLGKGRFIPNPYWFEFGTDARKRSGGGGTGRITPTPYFRPALTAARPLVKQAIVAGFPKILEGALK